MTGELVIRPAKPPDARAMVDLLNAIIARGGTTAHREPFDVDRMIADYIAPARGIACHVAERNGGILGFQALEWTDPDWAGANPLPADWALVATFVAIGAQGGGVGSRLFAATREAARALNPPPETCPPLPSLDPPRKGIRSRARGPFARP